MSLLLESGDVTSAAILTPYNGQLRLLRQLIRCAPCCTLDAASILRITLPANRVDGSWHAGTRGHCWQTLRLQQSMASRDVRPT